MVSKITIFEPHIDGLHFGDVAEEANESTTTEDEETGGRGSIGRLVGALAVVVLAVGLFARRQKGRTEAADESSLRPEIIRR